MIACLANAFAQRFKRWVKHSPSLIWLFPTRSALLISKMWTSQDFPGFEGDRDDPEFWFVVTENIRWINRACVRLRNDDIELLAWYYSFMDPSRTASISKALVRYREEGKICENFPVLFVKLLAQRREAEKLSKFLAQFEGKTREIMQVALLCSVRSLKLSGCDPRYPVDAYHEIMQDDKWMKMENFM